MPDPAKIFQGNPCKRGHDGQRWKSTGACVECARIRARQDPRRRGYFRKWRAENPEKAREISRRYREKNRDQRREYDRKYQAAHPEKGRERQRRYAAKNRDKLRAKARSYRQRLKDQGLCVACAKNLAITETYCWDCISKREDQERAIT